MASNEPGRANRTATTALSNVIDSNRAKGNTIRSSAMGYIKNRPQKFSAIFSSVFFSRQNLLRRFGKKQSYIVDFDNGRGRTQQKLGGKSLLPNFKQTPRARPFVFTNDGVRPHPMALISAPTKRLHLPPPRRITTLQPPPLFAIR